MAATLNFWAGFETVINGVRVRGGSSATPLSITLTGVKHENTFALASTSAKELLRVGSSDGDDISDFDFLYVVSTLPGTLEIQGTAEADSSAVKLKADTPFILGLDDTTAYAATSRNAAASQNIKKILFKPDAATATTVYIFAAT